jgi:hypothetical protein
MVRWVLAAVIVSCGCARAPDPEPAPAPVATAVATPPSASAVGSISAEPVASIAAPPPPPPAVDVRPIGMHIGGGPNDDANKAPLLASIAPHHEALGRCWAALPNKPKLEFGVDAHVPAKGGRARIERPRSTVKDASFVACAVAVYEQIEFLPPKSGLDTTVSASVRFSPRAH